MSTSLKNNIEEMFYNKLNDYEIEPPSEVWGKIEKQLPSNSIWSKFLNTRLLNKIIITTPIFIIC